MTQSPGWELVKKEIEAQMEQIRNIMVANTVRTVHETVTDTNGTKTLITTAEQQIAEHAGMYRMGRYIIDLVEKVVNGPSELARVVQEGIVSIENTDRKGGETHNGKQKQTSKRSR